MSLRKAIDNMCQSCIYDPYSEGTWRAQVEACTSSDCPLYPVRPITQKNRPKTGEIPKGLREYHNQKIVAKLT